jgi:hypothetical protein
MGKNGCWLRGMLRFWEQCPGIASVIESQYFMDVPYFLDRQLVFRIKQKCPFLFYRKYIIALYRKAMPN